MDNFEDMLSGAIQRGKAQGKKVTKAAASDKMSQEELKRLHSKYRLSLSDFIEGKVGQLPNHFPGFRYETVYGDRGWGAACYRDDAGSGRRDFYSRLEITVRPLGEFNVLDTSVRGTIRNKEIFQRSFFQELEEVEMGRFEETIQNWILSYAQEFSAAN
ncbi:MAG: hypothetical protein P8M80_04860 [Pirellulaceae bacterium]|jgi:hypothetical protein|nr:hypothetical protein [Mariniblastus sp.]MDB4756209.1 hypothetical protein [Mariniblastus sp.]MDG2468588.1 hypothetical protein [Pirellulaceae bacterium]